MIYTFFLFEYECINTMNIDHVVLWVENPKRSLKFFVDIFGMGPVREKEFDEGKVPFPSVRISDETILDLMDREMLPAVQDFTAAQAGGKPINHICLNVSKEQYEGIKARLLQQDVTLSSGGDRSFGAQGYTSHSEYFLDPDDNVIEIRYYD